VRRVATPVGALFVLLLLSTAALANGLTEQEKAVVDQLTIDPVAVLSNPATASQAKDALAKLGVNDPTLKAILTHPQINTANPNVKDAALRYINAKGFTDEVGAKFINDASDRKVAVGTIPKEAGKYMKVVESPPGVLSLSLSGRIVTPGITVFGKQVTDDAVMEFNAQLVDINKFPPGTKVGVKPAVPGPGFVLAIEQRGAEGDFSFGSGTVEATSGDSPTLTFKDVGVVMPFDVATLKSARVVSENGVSWLVLKTQDGGGWSAPLRNINGKPTLDVAITAKQGKVTFESLPHAPPWTTVYRTDDPKAPGSHAVIEIPLLGKMTATLGDAGTLQYGPIKFTGGVPAFTGKDAADRDIRTVVTAALASHLQAKNDKITADIQVALAAGKMEEAQRLAAQRENLAVWRGDVPGPSVADQQVWLSAAKDQTFYAIQTRGEVGVDGEMKSGTETTKKFTLEGGYPGLELGMRLVTDNGIADLSGKPDVTILASGSPRGRVFDEFNARWNDYDARRTALQKSKDGFKTFKQETEAEIKELKERSTEVVDFAKGILETKIALLKDDIKKEESRIKAEDKALSKEKNNLPPVLNVRSDGTREYAAEAVEGKVDILGFKLASTDYRDGRVNTADTLFMKVKGDGLYWDDLTPFLISGGFGTSKGFTIRYFTPNRNADTAEARTGMSTWELKTVDGKQKFVSTRWDSQLEFEGDRYKEVTKELGYVKADARVEGGTATISVSRERIVKGVPRYGEWLASKLTGDDSFDLLSVKVTPGKQTELVMHMDLDEFTEGLPGLARSAARDSLQNGFARGESGIGGGLLASGLLGSFPEIESLVKGLSEQAASIVRETKTPPKTMTLTLPDAAGDQVTIDAFVASATNVKTLLGKYAVSPALELSDPYRTRSVTQAVLEGDYDDITLHASNGAVLSGDEREDAIVELDSAVTLFAGDFGNFFISQQASVALDDRVIPFNVPSSMRSQAFGGATSDMALLINLGFYQDEAKRYVMREIAIQKIKANSVSTKVEEILKKYGK